MEILGNNSSLSDIWLNKMVEGIFVKTDPENSKAHTNERHDNNGKIEIYFASKIWSV